MTRLLFIAFMTIFIGNMEAQAGPTLQDDVYSSQSNKAEESSSNEVRWYQVELLIFKQRPTSNEIAEIWPKDISLSYPENWETLKTPEEYQALYQKKSVVNTPFILLDKKYFQLSALKNKLQVNRNNILFHGTWRQSLSQNLDQNAQSDVTSILIRGGDRFDDHNELEGSISLSLQRYLHIQTNLWLTRFVPIPTPAPATPVAAAAVSPASIDSTATVESVATWPTLPTFPLLKPANTSETTTAAIEKKYQVDEVVINKQSRRMRSYETHYIDHPKFGIVIRLIPLDTNSMLPIPPAQ